MIGRVAEMRRALEVLCRRRKNNPVFVGEPGVGKTAIVEGLAQKLLEEDGPEALKGAEIFTLDTGALLAGTRYRGDFEERFKAVIQALRKRPLPVLFIDEMHTMVGAGATTGGTMDLANLIKPILTEGEVRLMGSTTFEEFKHIEKDRALARRVQRIDVDEPNEGDTVRILQGLRPRYEQHHKVTYTDGALEVSARLARRHLRDARLPDSAIDVIDEAGAALRLSPPEDGSPRGGRAGGGAGRLAHGPHPGDAGHDLRPGAAAHAGRGAEAGRVRPGRGGRPGGVGHQAGAGGARPARAPRRHLPLHRPHRGGEDRARQAARAAPRQRVPALRHERVRREALGVAAHRRPAGLRGLRAGRAPRGRGAPAPLLGRAPRRGREGAPRPDEHPAPGHGQRDPHRQHAGARRTSVRSS